LIAYNYVVFYIMSFNFGFRWRAFSKIFRLLSETEVL
jgi:hypothetical protein